MMRKLTAWLNLAWHFAVHVTTRMPLRSFRAGRDLKRFSDAVFPEGYVPLDPAARVEFPRYMSCIHCGLCALACEALHERPTAAWHEAWTFVVGASRSLDNAGLVADDLAECALVPAAEQVCPMGIPINNMAATTRRIAAP